MGGAGARANDSVKLAGDARSYRSIGIPIGLIQVFKNTNVFRPDSKEFNPLHAIELISSPLHYTFDRTDSGPGERLVADLVKGRISRDLNQYRGFKPQSSFESQGLVSPSFGMTFRVKGDKRGPHQGIYLGVGPYLSVGTNARVDDRLIGILGSSSNTYLPNTTFTIADTTNGQAAAAITFGYRARFALQGQGTAAAGNQTGVARDRDGIYVSMNYNYLRGYRYDSADMRVRFDTDALGLITLAPATTPLTVEHSWASRGKGSAVDLGANIVVNHWDFNISANGIGNRINWSDRRAESLVLGSLLQGLSFNKTTLPQPSGEIRIKLPVQYLGGAAYHTDHWTASSEFAQGLQKFEYRGGAEYRLAIFEFRGGAHYKKKDWQPAAGVGLNFTKRFGIDAAVYGSSTNIEKKRKPALALSLRLGGS